MEFKEWLASTDYTVWDNAEVTAEAAWDYQQASIDGLLEDRVRDRSRINELEERAIESRRRIYDLERWVAGIADDKQMPTYVQQSARSLLTQEGECVDSLYERIKLLEQRVIDLQGHDDLSYIDKRLSEYSKVLYRIKPSDQGDYILESVVPTTFAGHAVNYVFRGRLEDCEKWRDELMNGVSDEI